MSVILFLTIVSCVLIGVGFLSRGWVGRVLQHQQGGPVAQWVAVAVLSGVIKVESERLFVSRRNGKRNPNSTATILVKVSSSYHIGGDLRDDIVLDTIFPDGETRVPLSVVTVNRFIDANSKLPKVDGLTTVAVETAAATLTELFALHMSSPAGEGSFTSVDRKVLLNVIGVLFATGEKNWKDRAMWVNQIGKLLQVDEELKELFTSFGWDAVVYPNPCEWVEFVHGEVLTMCAPAGNHTTAKTWGLR